jgi:hypothetical protein
LLHSHTSICFTSPSYHPTLVVLVHCHLPTRLKFKPLLPFRFVHCFPTGNHIAHTQTNTTSRYLVATRTRPSLAPGLPFQRSVGLSPGCAPHSPSHSCRSFDLFCPPHTHTPSHLVAHLNMPSSPPPPPSPSFTGSLSGKEFVVTVDFCVLLLDTNSRRRNQSIVPVHIPFDQSIRPTPFQIPLTVRQCTCHRQSLITFRWRRNRAVDLKAQQTYAFRPDRLINQDYHRQHNHHRRGRHLCNLNELILLLHCKEQDIPAHI